MARIPYDTAHAFMAGETGHNGAFKSTGTALYSYEMLLATREPDGTIELHYTPGTRISVATDRHMRALESVMADTTGETAR